MKILDSIPWLVIIAACATIGLAPFTPEPHIVEKIKWLVAGELSKPVDIFDLLMHGTPWILLLLKAIRR